MTLQSVYEQDKEKLITQWSGAGKEEIIKSAQAELDRVLYAFNDREDNGKVQEAANAMIQTAKASVTLLDTAGVTRIYGRTEYTGGKSREGKQQSGKFPLSFWILLVLGLVLAVPYIYISYRLLSQVSSEWRWYLLISTPVAAMIFLFIAGALMRKKVIEAGEEMHAEVLTDPMKVYHQLLSVILMIDQKLEEIRKSDEIKERRQEREQALGLDQAELDLLSQLLEDAYARRESDEMAAETISQIRFYLHRKHIDTVDWESGELSTGETAAGSVSGRNWFDMIPAYQAGTIRPALVSENRLLKKGLASTGAKV